MKKNVDKTLNVLDNLFWYGLYALPVLCILLYMFTLQDFPVDFSTLLSSIFPTFFSSDPIYTALDKVFGLSDGVLPILQPELVGCVSWFVGVYLCHLCVDVLLFIPRLCHKWIDDFGGIF